MTTFERQAQKAPSHCKNSGTKILTTNLPEHREGGQGQRTSRSVEHRQSEQNDLTSKAAL